MSFVAYMGRWFSFGAVSMVVTRPAVLVPAITSKQSAILASGPSIFCTGKKCEKNHVKEIIIF